MGLNHSRTTTVLNLIPPMTAAANEPVYQVSRIDSLKECGSKFVAK
jgi:hypothetical protein